MKSGLANRLYRGEAGIDVVGKRKLWFGIAGAIVLIAILGFIIRPFNFGIEFRGGAELLIPATAGSLQEAEKAVKDAGGQVVSAQQLGGAGTEESYIVRIGVEEENSQRAANELLELKNDVAERLDIPPNTISDNQVSAAWGEQVIDRALLSLLIFIAVVIVYLVFRFEWRMAVAAVASLLLDLILTAGVYSLVGFQVTPSTVIGFLTILGFALYDVVVVFDKVQENTRGITGGSLVTYPEAANLAVNQTLMRSINTGLVALLPVGGLLFIGAGLLGAGTLKDLGLVLFIGMGAAVYSSIFFATPVLVQLKIHEPRYQAHTQRVMARRASGGKEAAKVVGGKARPAPSKVAAGKTATATLDPDTAEDTATEVAAVSASAPRPGGRPGGRQAQGKRSGGRSGRPGGKRR